MSDTNDEGTDGALDAAAVDGLRRAIRHRRSMGLARLKPDAVDQSLIEAVLEAADWGPSHGETEPWRFTVYTGAGRQGLGEAFAEAYRTDAEAGGGFKEAVWEAQRNRALSAPVWISIGMTPALRPDGVMRMSEEDEVMAVACAVQNLHLMASALGLAGMWLSQGTSVHPEVARFVGLERPSRLLGFFILGWPNVAWPGGERRPLAEKVRWVRDAPGGVAARSAE